jgi:hypothetical protein
MTGTFLDYGEVMDKVEMRERERKELIEWYKKRIEIMSARLSKKAK